MTISVTDNAGGMPPEMVKPILDFDVRVSDKSPYRSPTRGQMGNAWKTILGIPYALGGKQPAVSEAPVVIEARGIKHLIRASLDPAGDVQIEYNTRRIENAPGTTVTVTLPEVYGQHFEPELWVRSAALYNPHLLISSHHGDYVGGETRQMYEPTFKDPSKFKKVKPNAPTNPHWYDVAALERNIFAHIKHAGEDGGKDLAIGAYIGTFAGLKRTQLQAEVRQSLATLGSPLRRLSDFEGMDEEERREATARLLAAMHHYTDPPKHDTFGRLGKAHFKARFEEMHGIDIDNKGKPKFWYKSIDGYQDDIPWRFEVAAAQVDDPDTQLFAGINYSPTLDEPLEKMMIRTPEETGFGLARVLYQLHALPHKATWGTYRIDRAEDQPPVVVAIHFISPVVRYRDVSKSSIDTIGLSPIQDALWAVTKELYKEENKRRKQASRPAKEGKPEGEKEPNLKEASFMVMDEAVKHVSGDGALPYGARRLFYRVRDAIAAVTSKRFNSDSGYEYFRNTILQEYQREHHKLENLYYDPRGRLHEPHTGKTVDIGTREVEAYSFPDYVFDKILFVEKKGQMPLLEAAKIAECYDMAIMTSEGFATEAARVLLESASKEHDYQLFVLHDADPSGYSIARTVREETERMPEYSVNVIDLGLLVEEVVDLEAVYPEEFVSKKPLEQPLLESLERGSLAREWFVGKEIEITEDGKKKKAWKRKRIELDSLSAPQVIAYLERRLEEEGVRGKVIPPDDYLKDDARKKHEAEVHKQVQHIVNKLASTRRIQKIVTRLFRERYQLGDARRWIEEGFEEDDSQSWEEPLKRRLASRSGELEADLEQTVRRVFEKMLEEEERD